MRTRAFISIVDSGSSFTYANNERIGRRISQPVVLNGLRGLAVGIDAGSVGRRRLESALPHAMNEIPREERRTEVSTNTVLDRPQRNDRHDHCVALTGQHSSWRGSSTCCMVVEVKQLEAS